MAKMKFGVDSGRQIEVYKQLCNESRKIFMTKNK